jgi:hypothetical protein
MPHHNGDRQFLAAVQLLLRMKAGGALEYLLQEAGWAHYCLLRNHLVKRCPSCGNPGCKFAGKSREFDLLGIATDARIIE